MNVPGIRSRRLVWVGLGVIFLLLGQVPAALSQPLDTTPPAEPVKLVFVHHSTGGAWLADSHGQLGLALKNNNYFVSDTNYGWGPPDQDQGYGTIGDHTDIPHWYSWFTGPHRQTYMTALFAESAQHSTYSRMATDPGGANAVVVFKSCFPNSNLDGNPTDGPAPSANNFSSLTVANAKRIYIDLLAYFAAHQETLFVVIAAPPLRSADTTVARAANARAFNNWLVNDWLVGYAHSNVTVFDFYTVLTSNGGDAATNDLGATGGNHHRYRSGVIDHTTDQATNYLAYPTGDSHPSAAGGQKATGEFVPLLNIAYHRWQRGTIRPRADYTGDLKSDILWRHATSGDVWLWPMDGAARTAEAYVHRVADTNWEIRGQGDLTGDGKADIFWRHTTTGALYHWPMDGHNRLAETYVGTVSPAYHIVGTGDFDRDGKLDIVWRNLTNGEVWIWLMDGATPLSQTYIGTVDPAYVIEGVGDLDGDGKADLVWRHVTAGETWVWLMNGTNRLSATLVTTVPDVGFQIAGVADFTGDGKADILWHHQTAGEVWLWPMDGTNRLAETWVGTVLDTGFAVVGSGDYNGDGKADVLWRHASLGEVWVWLMDGATALPEALVGVVPDTGFRIVKAK